MVGNRRLRDAPRSVGSDLRRAAYLLAAATGESPGRVAIETHTLGGITLAH